MLKLASWILSGVPQWHTTGLFSLCVCVCVSSCVSTSLCLSLSVCLSVSLCLSMSLCLCLSLSLCPSLPLSFSLTVPLSHSILLSSVCFIGMTVRVEQYSLSLSLCLWSLTHACVYSSSVPACQESVCEQCEHCQVCVGDSQMCQVVLAVRNLLCYGDLITALASTLYPGLDQPALRQRECTNQTFVTF